MCILHHKIRRGGRDVAGQKGEDWKDLRPYRVVVDIHLLIKRDAKTKFECWKVTVIVFRMDLFNFGD